jgi:hypothetical protein
MLKIYTRKYWVSINNKEWEQVWWERDMMKDNPPSEEVVVNQLSFDEFYTLLQHGSMGHIRAGKTLFRKKPKITIEYDYDRIKHYTHFDTISCKVTYEEIKGATLYSIMRCFPAELVIQYLKERGITTCPMNF